MVYAMGSRSNHDEICQLVAEVAGGVALRVKVVPGASRSRITGILADRLKVTVAAPPEAGKANAAVCALLAKAFDAPDRDVSVIAGAQQPLKTIEVAGLDLARAVECLKSMLAK